MPVLSDASTSMPDSSSRAASLQAAANHHRLLYHKGCRLSHTVRSVCQNMLGTLLARWQAPDQSLVLSVCSRHLFTMAFSAAISLAPTASTVVVTTGMPAGSMQ